MSSAGCEESYDGEDARPGVGHPRGERGSGISGAEEGNGPGCQRQFVPGGLASFVKVPSRRRCAAILLTSALYGALVVAVLTTSPLVALDWRMMLLRPYEQWPQWNSMLNFYVVLGQRGPTATIAAAWLVWRCRRTRTLRPLLVGTTALVLLNISVGAVKVGLGRLGPHYATALGSSELFRGGDIFPSGHTSNAVVTWGVLAYLAARHRRTAAAAAAALAVTVGLTTLYLGTHWLSDVLAGWAAGVLVLLVLPVIEPALARAEDRLLRIRAVRQLLGRAAQHPEPEPELPAPRHDTHPVAGRGPGPPSPVTAVQGTPGGADED